MTRFDGMRIALLGPVPPPSGGMANQTQQLCELLSAAGAELTRVQPIQPTARSPRSLAVQAGR